jgi:hypothetical protein
MLVSGLHHYEDSRLMKVILFVSVDSHDPTLPLNILSVEFVLIVLSCSIRWHSLATVINECLPSDRGVYLITNMRILGVQIECKVVADSYSQNKDKTLHQGSSLDQDAKISDLQGKYLIYYFK